MHAHVNAGHMLEHGVATTADATAAYAFYRQAAVRWSDVEASVRAAALLYEGRVSAQIASWEQGMRTAKEASPDAPLRLRLLRASLVILR